MLRDFPAGIWQAVTDAIAVLLPGIFLVLLMWLCARDVLQLRDRYLSRRTRPGRSRRLDPRGEHTMFAGADDGAPEAERPRYGGLDLVGRPTGSCPRFGSCHLVPRREFSTGPPPSAGGRRHRAFRCRVWDVLEPVIAAAID